MMAQIRERWRAWWRPRPEFAPYRGPRMAWVRDAGEGQPLQLVISGPQGHVHADIDGPRALQLARDLVDGALAMRRDGRGQR